MINVRYIYSACVVITTPDVSVISDPWFTDGIYDGSWFQFPKMENPIDVIGKVDYIYVSHIHPDHYDPIFLRKYLEVYPNSRIIIANFQNNFLAKKMSADGIPFEIVKEEMAIGKTVFKIFPNETGSASDVDSIFAIKFEDHGVLNLNDNPFNEPLLNEVLRFHPQYQIALLPYTGAGPYPQTYYSDTETLKTKADAKKKDFFQRYLVLRDKINPLVSIPFAGKYLLGGDKTKLNAFRGVADPVEVLGFDPRAIVLEDGGTSSIDTVNLKPNSSRTTPYPKEAIEKRLSHIKTAAMAYERHIQLPSQLIPWKRLLPKAYQNALRYSEAETDYFFCLKFSPSEFFVMNCRKDSKFGQFCEELQLAQYSPRSVILIDYRYLFGLLTSIYHWNNAEIGSQYMVKRVPDEFRREVQRFLNFFHL
jgi:UDP-MurNAc hydroxylase